VGCQQKQKPRIQHFRIFASLPGLNGLRLCCRAIHLNVGKKPEPVSTKRFVKDLSDLRPERLNQIDALYLPPATP
jgi:hypothetical protein